MRRANDVTASENFARDDYAPTPMEPRNMDASVVVRKLASGREAEGGTVPRSMRMDNHLHDSVLDMSD